MQVLITGGAGYLGSVLTSHLLRHGHHVRVLDCLRHGVSGLSAMRGDIGLEVVRGDVRSSEAVEQVLTGVDAVVHLAAIVGDPACARKPLDAWGINYEATKEVVRAAARRGVRRFVFASTCSNYGKMAGDTPYVGENAPLRPLSLYAESKVAAEKELLGASEDVPAVSTVLRFATLYGLSPRMRFDLTVNEFTLTLATGQKLIVFGEQFWRPYLHVRDAAEAIGLVLESAPALVAGEVFNVGSTAENYRKLDIVRLLTDRIPTAQVEFVAREEDPRDYRVSCERIQERLGFVPRHAVADGIAEICDAIRQGEFQDHADPGYRN